MSFSFVCAILCENPSIRVFALDDVEMIPILLPRKSGTSLKKLKMLGSGMLCTALAAHGEDRDLKHEAEKMEDSMSARNAGAARTAITFSARALMEREGMRYAAKTRDDEGYR